jgi:hypothetical protein
MECGGRTPLWLNHLSFGIFKTAHLLVHNTAKAGLVPAVKALPSIPLLVTTTDQRLSFEAIVSQT